MSPNQVLSYPVSVATSALCVKRHAKRIGKKSTEDMYCYTMLYHLVMNYCNEHHWTPPKFEVHFSTVFRWFLQGAAMFTTRQLMQRTDVMKRLAHHPGFDAWTNERGRSWRFGKAPTFWVVIQSVGFGYLLYDAVCILFFGYRNIYCEFYHVNLVVKSPLKRR